MLSKNSYTRKTIKRLLPQQINHPHQLWIQTTYLGVPMGRIFNWKLKQNFNIWCSSVPFCGVGSCSQANLADGAVHNGQTAEWNVYLTNYLYGLQLHITSQISGGFLNTVGYDLQQLKNWDLVGLISKSPCGRAACSWCSSISLTETAGGTWFPHCILWLLVSSHGLKKCWNVVQDCIEGEGSCFRCLPNFGFWNPF